jgi:hypothetical protein
MPRQPMGRRVKAARGKRARFDKFLLRVRMYGRIMSDGNESTVPLRAEAYTLTRCGAHAHIMEDLPPRQCNLYRLLQVARGERSQNRLGMDTQLGSETAPDRGAHDLDPLWIDLQRASQRGAGSIDDLRADIDQEIIPAWHGEACIRLHGLGEAIWRVVVLVDLNGSASELRLEIAHRTIGRQAED